MEEKRFREYLIKKGHTQATLSTYPLMLKRDIPNEVKKIDKEFPNNLFKVNDINFLNDLYTRCLKGDLQNFNTSTQNRAPSASLKKYIEFIQENKVEKNNTNGIKNIMLYGAPGVGKTHNYKKLITMIEEGKSEKEIFKSISKNENVENEYDEQFQTIKDDKRIEFVTFHQSYSYEDFIEGFRPNEDGNIELEDGVFKLISENAMNNLKNSQININNKPINIDELIQKFTNNVQDSLDKNEKFTLGDKILIDSINEKGSFLLGGSIKNDTQRLTIDMVKRDYESYKKGDISTYEDVKPKFESKRTFHGNARYYFMLYKKLEDFEKKLKPDSIEQVQENQKNFYIVIDEINRGNISKIFGELITLIEEDKRDSYEVTLPYSKEKFKIPSNLYIIATMNSTDKSIATIDIALRRRFTFLKMEPNIDLVPEIAKELFSTLNEYISKNLNKDFQLGHSYFMKIENSEDLEFVKEYKIKPLLEEYFYADDEKLKVVLDMLG